MTIQRYNPEMVNLLSANFTRRDEPNFAWVNAISAGMMLNGLVGCWPMSTVDATGAVKDISGNGKTLTNNNTVTLTHSILTPYAEFVAANTEYLSRADEADLDIIGNEAYIDASKRGLTVMTWFKVNSLGAARGLVSKWLTLGNNFSYRIYVTAANNVEFQISNTGAAAVTVTSTGTVTADNWFFAAGRFTPSAELSVWIGSTEDTNVVAIPATIFNGGSSLVLGRTDGGSYLDGSMGITALCRAALSDELIKSFYWQTAALFEQQ